MSDTLVEGKKKKSAVSTAAWVALIRMVDGFAEDWTLVSLHKRSLLSETSVCYFHEHQVVEWSGLKRHRLMIYQLCP